MKPDDPARIPPARLKLYQRYLLLLRRSGQGEIADQIDRILFQPIVAWEDR
jgi:hypothetical protein